MENEETQAKKSKKEEAKVIELTAVITGTAPAFKLADGKVVSMEEYLVWMGNVLLKLEKTI